MGKIINCVFLIQIFSFAVHMNMCSSTCAVAVDDQPLSTEPVKDCPKQTCENGWVTLRDKCLRLLYTPVRNYPSASNICRDKYNTNLLTIQSPEEQRLLEELFIESAGGNSSTTLSYVYLGGVRCPNEVFHWLGPNGTQTPVSFQHWFYNQPGTILDSCLAFNLVRNHQSYTNYTYGRWSAISCLTTGMVVCERSTENIRLPVKEFTKSY